MKKYPRIAIVYDHLLTQYGGAEQVLTAVLASFPEAELFSTIQDKKITNWQQQTQVHLSSLQRIFTLVRRREILDVLTPITIEQCTFTNFDIIISITSSAVKGILTRPRQLHVCYLLSPTRYLYDSSATLLQQHPTLSLPVLSWLAKKIFAYLRWWDQVAVWRPDYLISISDQVSKRCLKTYQRQSDAIIYPPVAMPHPFIDNSQDLDSLADYDYLLSISRLVPYKRIDLAIAAALYLRRVLVVVGTGQEYQRLLQKAGSQAYQRSLSESLGQSFKRAQKQKKVIIFMQNASEREKAVLLGNCTAVIMPGIEDFGITALEATAYGKPVVIAAESGVAEILKNGKEAIHFSNQTETNLVSAIEKVSATTFEPSTLIAKAREFSQEEFVRKFHKTIFAFYKEHSTIKQ
jgi:glycosyltransferase involved in cell wall biosynthesis